MAEKYIAKESYDRAIPLLEELIVLTRGSERSERVNYLHAKCTYRMKDYTLGSLLLGQFRAHLPQEPIC